MARAASLAALLVAALSALAAGMAASDAPQPPSNPPAAELEAITVTGKKREQVFRERVSTFVSSVSA